jgi:hypothetical protein
MTTETTDKTAKAKAGGIKRWVLGSMWGFWVLLLAFSLGLAAVIHLIWLRGNV